MVQLSITELVEALMKNMRLDEEFESLTKDLEALRKSLKR